MCVCVFGNYLFISYNTIHIQWYISFYRGINETMKKSPTIACSRRYFGEKLSSAFAVIQ